MPKMNLICLATLFAGLGITQTRFQWNSRSASDPLPTAEERLRIYLHNAFYSPGAWMRAAGPALGQQLSKSPSFWEQDGGGFAKRFGTQMAMFTTRDTVQAIGTSLYGHDPRYQRCGCKGVMRRMGHAVSGLWLAADANGQRKFDLSFIGGSYAAGFVGASLYPQPYTLHVKGFQLGHQQVGQVALGNIGVEFGPDIRRFLKAKILRR